MPRSRPPATVDRAMARARLLIALEAAAVGAAVAAWSAPAGLIAAAVIAGWRARFASRRLVLRALERADPRARNVIVTADELASGALRAKPPVRERVDADADAVLAAIDLRAVFPVRRLAALSVIALVAWGTAAAVRQRSVAALRNDVAARPEPRREPPAFSVVVKVEPPPYTHLPPAVSVDPAQIDAIEHAAVQLSIQGSGGGAVTVDHTGDVQRLQPDRDGMVEYHFAATRSGYVLVVSSDGRRRMLPVSVKSDALPVVTITAPARDLVYEGGNPTITFNTRATDDYGLRALALRFTKVSGSGEQFVFADGDIPLTLTRHGERDWSGAAVRTLSQLGLAEGDMLVYRAVASDMRPGGVEASSDAFYIEVSKLGVASGDAFTLPEQETRYALSQQMLIVKTERLNQRRASTDAGEFLEAAQSLAVEQRMIRSEFVFMLGGEIEDEEVEAEQSVEIQAGRLINRGQRDIRAATVAMSEAEKHLTGGNTGEALRAERAAVEALQRAFARDRYILRALASRSQLDLSRRLTGSPAGAAGWRRQPPEPDRNRTAIALQSLLQGLGEAKTRAQLDALGEFAMRTDSESPALRAIAAALQKLADEWPVKAEPARTAQLDAIAEMVSAEARRVLADSPPRFSGAR